MADESRRRRSTALVRAGILLPLSERDFRLYWVGQSMLAVIVATGRLDLWHVWAISAEVGLGRSVSGPSSGAAAVRRSKESARCQSRHQ